MSVVILFFFFCFYNLYFNWNFNTTVLFFCLLLSLLYGSPHLLCLILHYLWFTSTWPFYNLWLSHKASNQGFCFVFFCNEICTPGWEACFQLHFFFSKQLTVLHAFKLKNHFFYRDLWMNFAKYGFRWRRQSWIVHIRL